MMRRDNTDSLKSAEVVYNFDPMAFLSNNYATKVQTNHQRIHKQNQVKSTWIVAVVFVVCIPLIFIRDKILRSSHLYLNEEQNLFKFSKLTSEI